LKLIHAAVISTTLIIVFGISIVVPNFMHPYAAQRQKILLSVSVIGPTNVSVWCSDLAAQLRENGKSATIFFAGKIAEMFPESVREFPSNIDIGSETYSYVDLASLKDPSLQLEEVDKGKFVVDLAGNLSSKLFKAPFGSTTGDTYSLLRTSGIEADFSYDDHYNVRVNNQFMKYGCSAYDGYEHPANFFISLPKTDRPIILNFNNTLTVSYIIEIVSQLQSSDVEFVSASELTGLSLTERR
jgi:peptidoglycan/xylan/chitin deacetylase (PgdA/CDA1 family)